MACLQHGTLTFAEKPLHCFYKRIDFKKYSKSEFRVFDWLRKRLTQQIEKPINRSNWVPNVGASLPLGGVGMCRRDPGGE
jgi:hypothetical protein